MGIKKWRSANISIATVNTIQNSSHDISCYYVQECRIKCYYKCILVSICIINHIYVAGNFQGQNYFIPFQLFTSKFSSKLFTSNSRILKLSFYFWGNWGSGLQKDKSNPWKFCLQKISSSVIEFFICFLFWYIYNRVVWRDTVQYQFIQGHYLDASCDIS